MTTKRLYPYSDMEMLLAAKTIARNFSDHLHLLSQYHNHWTPEYALELAQRIDQTIDTHFGKNGRKVLKESTNDLMNVISSALRELTLFRTLIKQDFKEDSKDILASLSFNTHYHPAKRNKSQLHLISLLAGFSLGMTDELRSLLISKGFKKEFIDGIIDYSQNIRDLNTRQEVLKESSQLITLETVTVMNSIYREITLICKIAQKSADLNTVARNHFNFNKIVKNMSWERKKKKTGNEEAGTIVNRN